MEDEAPEEEIEVTDEESEEETEEETEEEPMMENKKPVNEVVMSTALLIAAGIVSALVGSGQLLASAEKKRDIKQKTAELIANGMSPVEAAKKALELVNADWDKPAYGYQGGGKGGFNPGSNLEEDEKELNEAYNTIKTIKKELAEVNLFNAKLLYTNKIFKSKNLTESQKVKVLAAFDKAANVEEAKLVFETLSEGFTSKKAPMNESLIRGGASKAAGVATKKPIMEANDQVARWQKLAGIK
jgi:hypothetical protein